MFEEDRKTCQHVSLVVLTAVLAVSASAASDVEKAADNSAVRSKCQATEKSKKRPSSTKCPANQKLDTSTPNDKDKVLEVDDAKTLRSLSDWILSR